MSRKFDHQWSQLASFENLILAFRKAAKGKRSKPSVAAFEFDLEPNLFALQAELRDGNYLPGGYASFHIHEPKRRLISAAPFRDRVVHHALVNVIEPIYERKFIHDVYANRNGKGTHRALDRCTQFLRRFEYVLPMDVRQFFPSIDHAILHGVLAQTLADQRVLDLASKIIAGGAGVQRDEYEMVYFPGDDLFAADRPRGLPAPASTSSPRRRWSRLGSYWVVGSRRSVEHKRDRGPAMSGPWWACCGAARGTTPRTTFALPTATGTHLTIATTTTASVAPDRSLLARIRRVGSSQQGRDAPGVL